MEALREQEVCPSCGEFVSVLLKTTGWCRECSNPLIANGRANCTRCGRDNVGDPCNRCKYELWLERNADSIERYMVAGLSYVQAKRRVREETTPKCLCCGDRIKGAISAYFCSKKSECRRAARIYRFKRQYYHMSLDDALRETMRQLTSEWAETAEIAEAQK